MKIRIKGYRLKVKERLCRSVFLFLLVLLASCGKDETSPATTNTVVPQRDIPTGSIPTPGWNVAPDYDYSSSMTAVIDVDLTQTYPELMSDDWKVDTGDLLAAFAGETCVGVTSPSGGLFFLYITAPAQGDDEIVLRYYSAQLRNIFLSDMVFSFENGARLGSVVDPLNPEFMEEES